MKPILTVDDFKAAAIALGVDTAAVRAVTDVESLGGGFLGDGRPKILYERHVMYDRLIREAGLGEAVHFATTYPEVVNRKPGGYATGPTAAARGAAEWDRMATAVTIHRQCALESASWGMFQIMGYHWSALHYSTVQAFVNAMYDSEAAQLDAFVRFVRVDPLLHRALQAHDWTTFARRYNGPNFAKNNYHVKLNTSWLKFNKEPT